MTKAAALRWAVITAALLCAAALAFVSCGMGKQPAGSGGLQAADSTFTDLMGSLESAFPGVLAELDALACPEGVDSALWTELKSALQTQLTESRPGSPARLLDTSEDSGAKAPRTGDGENHGRDARATKIVSTPPTGEANRVNDLAIADNGDGTYSLTWHYRNLGDYGQNGKVGISDITPIAMHFQETWEAGEEDTLPAVIDGSGNGKVGIEDVTAIAQCFQREVARYVIEGAESSEGPWSAVGEVAQAAGTGDGRLEYAETIQSPAALWHRVVPYDAEGNPGEPSNAVLRPSNEPIIYEVSPTTGYQHEECTFTATVSGAEPLTYAWDFGGGATPNTSSDPSPTVTLSDAGEYEANLTVINAYGSADYPFILTINERDQWVHTWGGPSYEEAEDVAVDGEGNIYVLGYTESFGAGSSDVLVLKYSPDGVLQWTRTWGGEIFDDPVRVAVLSDGNILVGGSTPNFGSGNDDIFILKYDPSGQLLLQTTWGTADYERANDMAVDEEDNIYFAGVRLVFGGTSDVLVAKFTPAGSCTWAQTWGNSGVSDDGLVVAASSQRCYVGVRPNAETTDYDVGILAYAPEGTLEWAISWGGDGTEAANCLAVAPSGNLLVGGITRSFGDESGDAFLLEVDDSGAVISEATWGRADRDGFADILCSVRGFAYLIGNTKEPTETYSRGMVIQWNGGLSFTSSTAIGDAGSNLLSGVEDSWGNLIVAGTSRGSTITWEPVNATVDQPGGHTQWLLGTNNVLDGMSTTAEGFEETPQGEFGGGVDVLVIRNPLS